jgi:hypothetical protein
MLCSYTKTRKAYSLFITALTCILFSGCAGQRWAEPLPEEEHDRMVLLISAMQQVEGKCPDSLDADARIFWKGPLDDWAVEGYFQLLSPTFIKFIISNPLGQPIFAFASTVDEFQILRPNQYLHIRGKVRSLAMRQEIPQILTQGDWFAYLTGRLPTDSLEILEVNRDASDESIWLHLSPAGPDRTQGSVWTHVNPLQGGVLGYLFLDRNGATLAEIDYGNQQNRKDVCTAVGEIRISELPWGAEITIQLEDINDSSQLGEKEFSLPVPPGYTTQLQL